MIEKEKEFKFLLSNTEEKYFLANFGNELKVLHPNRLLHRFISMVDFYLYKIQN